MDGVETIYEAREEVQRRGFELKVHGGGVPRRFRASELRQILRLAAMIVLSLQRQRRHTAGAALRRSASLIPHPGIP